MKQILLFEFIWIVTWPQTSGFLFTSAEVMIATAYSSSWPQDDRTPLQLRSSLQGGYRRSSSPLVEVSSLDDVNTGPNADGEIAIRIFSWRGHREWRIVQCRSSSAEDIYSITIVHVCFLVEDLHPVLREHYSRRINPTLLLFMCSRRINPTLLMFLYWRRIISICVLNDLVQVWNNISIK